MVLTIYIHTLDVYILDGQIGLYECYNYCTEVIQTIILIRVIIVTVVIVLDIAIILVTSKSIIVFCVSGVTCLETFAHGAVFLTTAKGLNF